MIVIKDTLFCFVIFMLNLNLLFINVSLGINEFNFRLTEVDCFMHAKILKALD